MIFCRQLLSTLHYVTYSHCIAFSNMSMFFKLQVFFYLKKWLCYAESAMREKKTSRSKLNKVNSRPQGNESPSSARKNKIVSSNVHLWSAQACSISNQLIFFRCDTAFGRRLQLQQILLYQIHSYPHGQHLVDWWSSRFKILMSELLLSCFLHLTCCHSVDSWQRYLM